VLTDHVRRVIREKAQQDPGVGGKHKNKRAADIQARHVFRHYPADGPQDALTESVTQDNAGACGVEFCIDVEQWTMASQDTTETIRSGTASGKSK
jgi:hypothetical protein